MRQDRIWPVPSATIPATLSLPPRPGIKSYAPPMGHPCWRCQVTHKSVEERDMCARWYKDSELGAPAPTQSEA